MKRTFSSKVSATIRAKVSTPKVRLLGSPSRTKVLKPKNTRTYAKTPLKDGMAFSNFGFGDTGLTGED